ncbi:MAG: hypothetical protein AAF518_17850, partial [Spirochaetota bacterium]
CEVTAGIVHRDIKPSNLMNSCYHGNSGVTNIPYVEALLEYGNIEEVVHNYSIEDSINRLAKTVGWKGSLESCNKDYRCYLMYRLYYALEYARKKRNGNSTKIQLP